MSKLHWLPPNPDIRNAIKAFPRDESTANQFDYLRDLAGYQLDFNNVRKVDRLLQTLLAKELDAVRSLPQLRLAVLASSTVDHLQSAIRVAALRRGLAVQIYVAPYGQYRQEILDKSSQLYQFAPDIALLILDHTELRFPKNLDDSWAAVDKAINNHVLEWADYWQILSQAEITVIQQTFLPPDEHVFGHYDVNLPAIPNSFTRLVNLQLKRVAREHNILLLDVEALAASVGTDQWYSPTFWHHAKQAISSLQAPLYGDHVSRLLAALRGLASKCLVLDLDNTLWGGVIGDDGLSGIELGQGTGTGEAFQAFQRYAKALKQRGIILAVCSKNNEKTALEPFEKHPEMVLKAEDFAIFVANWEDKAQNLKMIARQLNIGLDSLVFFDDNPAERAVVRQFAPSVSVPEVPDDPAYYIKCLSDGGYFEAIAFSQDDARRAEQYRANQQRQALQAKTHNIDSFLQRLEMDLSFASVDDVSLQRTVQLINRSNQFNLTTRRYTEAQVKNMLAAEDIDCWQVRLKDIFGDNGLISVLITRAIEIEGQAGLKIDTWLMSCRVLGRQVEQAVLNALVEQARRQRRTFLVGEYLQTPKNEMVQDHYGRLGFQLLSQDLNSNHHLFERSGSPDIAIKTSPHRSVWRLDLSSFKPFTTFIQSSISTEL